MHLKKYITATNKFTIEVHLWDGRPVGVVFYSWTRKKKLLEVSPSLKRTVFEKECIASTWLCYWYSNFFPIKAKKKIYVTWALWEKKTMLELGLFLTPTQRCRLKDMESAPVLTSSRNWKNTASLFVPNKKTWLFQSITEMRSIEKCWELITFYFPEGL